MAGKSLFLAFCAVLQVHAASSTFSSPSTLSSFSGSSLLSTASRSLSTSLVSSSLASTPTSMPASSSVASASGSVISITLVPSITVSASSSLNATLTPTTTSSAPNSTSTLPPDVLADIAQVHERRLSFITTEVIAPNYNITSIPDWLRTLDSNGRWPDSEVDYTTGCTAQRANWPAQNHWIRLNAMSAAWHAAIPGVEKFVGDNALFNAISRAMNFWFSNDFTVPGCIDSGGTPACPCGTPGFWNTNWFSNIILIPTYVGETCLVMNDTLTDTQLQKCSDITSRAFAQLGRFVNGVGNLTGANTLDVASIGIDLGLLTLNQTLVQQAYDRVHQEVIVQNAIKADGIRADGSFGQHAGILYNGNYGKDYTNDVLELEGAAARTRFEASSISKSAFNTLVDGHQWMIYRNSLTKILHWDFSVFGRFISFSTMGADIIQVTANIQMNITQIRDLGNLWNSTTLLKAYDTLSRNTSNANQGNLKGNRMFYANDYMVQRGNGYVTTLKMYSSRTLNTECTNLANPFGFHLSDGAFRTYLNGNEYEDIAGGMDWNLIPGTTVDYNATALTCDKARATGVSPFVGGASDGKVGVAAMQYTNPLTNNLTWSKAWFFLDDDTQVVAVSNITSLSNASVFSVLDQRRRDGDVYLDGVRITDAAAKKIGGDATQRPPIRGDSLWHGGVGYVFRRVDNQKAQLQLSLQRRTGNWTALGTSVQPFIPVDFFTAWLDHRDLNQTAAYMIFPATKSDNEFRQKASNRDISVLRNDASAVAIHDGDHDTTSMVFWNTNGTVVIPSQKQRVAPIIVTSSAPITMILNQGKNTITVADPAQMQLTVNVTLMLGPGKRPEGWGAKSKTLLFSLPSGGVAGQSVTQSL